ncbi:MAG: preprotein translocase subunit YajC [Candidatus Omnitrophica bacterium]|nr:preprotein translocase subunit YajC [Candidatus Omnitrophota bacterium]
MTEPSPILQFVPLLILFTIFYFLLIRPQQKKQKEHAQMLGKLDKNDEIVTSGGIYGTIVAVNEKTVIVRIADNVKIEMDKGSIQQVLKSRTH